MKSKNDRYLYFSALLFILIIMGSWGYLITVENLDVKGFFSSQNLSFASRFFSRLIFDGDQTPAYLDLKEISAVWILMMETLQMSILSILIASLSMLITMIPMLLTKTALAPPRHWNMLNRFVEWLIQALYLLSRSVPELIWAMLLVFVLKPGVLPGALALAVHNYGILGKLCLEVVENMDRSPLQGLLQAGANQRQILLYGVLPTIAPKFISYIVYRWEVILRTTIVVGMVGAGGLGYAFKLHLSWFHYTHITLIISAYLLLVYLCDKLSETLRQEYT